MKMTGNTMMITGATSGIGRALAEAFSAEGNTVVITGRRQHLLDEVVARNPGMVGIAVDLLDPASVERMIEAVKLRFPRLNVLINNAGVYSSEDFSSDEVDLPKAFRTIQTNINSVLQVTTCLLPTLRSQPSSTLMVTTSGLAFVPYPPGPVYSASKAFMHSWLDALRIQLRKTSVEVLELAPPLVQTELGGAEQASDPNAMPLANYTAEVLQILEEGNLEKGEILVDRVKFLRFAERQGKYQEALEMMQE